MISNTSMKNLLKDSTSFHRIIMPNVIRQSRLVLPKKFVIEYGNELSTSIKLCIPLGAAWDIELKPYGGYLLYLGVGLENFIKHYSIRVGYFLLFKYKGNLEFDVHVFDLTATEIRYPVIQETRPRGVAIKEEDGTETSIPKKKLTTHVTRLSNRNSVKETLVVVDQVEKCPLDAEAMYKPENPSFIVKLQDYHVKARIFHLPCQFCRDYMDGVPEFIQILDSYNMTWLVRCIKTDDHVSLCKGWPQFVKEKGLKTDDVCIFELIESDAMKVSVLIEK